MENFDKAAGSEDSKEDIKGSIKQKKDLLSKLDKGHEYMKIVSEIALLQIKIAQYERAESNLQSCQDFFKKQKDRLGQASVMGLLGTVSFKKRDFDQSIEYYRKAYKIYDDLTQVKEKIMCLKGIGRSYMRLSKSDDAADVFFNCCEICSNNDAVYSFLDCLGNLIQIYEQKEEWDVVFELYQKTLKTFQKMRDKRGMITSYFNLGILKKRTQEFEQSLKYFTRGNQIAKESNYSELILKGLSYWGECLFNLGKKNEAKEKFIEGLKIAKKIDAENAIKQLNLLLRTIGYTPQEISEELTRYKKKE